MSCLIPSWICMDKTKNKKKQRRHKQYRNVLKVSNETFSWSCVCHRGYVTRMHCWTFFSCRSLCSSWNEKNFKIVFEPHIHDDRHTTTEAFHFLFSDNNYCIACALDQTRRSNFYCVETISSSIISVIFLKYFTIQQNYAFLCRICTCWPKASQNIGYEKELLYSLFGNIPFFVCQADDFRTQ